MIQEGSRVRHKNQEINDLKGIMMVFGIKNNYAVCGYGDFDRLGQEATTYLISELKLAE